MLIFNVVLILIMAGIFLLNWGIHKYIKDEVGLKVISTLYDPIMTLLKGDPSNYSHEKYDEMKATLDKEMGEFIPETVNLSYIWRSVKIHTLWGLGKKHQALKNLSFYEKVKHIAD